MIENKRYGSIKVVLRDIRGKIMLDRRIYSNRLLIKDIEKEDFPFINDMYKDMDFYFYAIGHNTNLCEKYFKQLIKGDNRLNFFCIAKLLSDSRSVGCIEGSVHLGSKKILWINSIMIHKEFCRHKYGTELVMATIDYFKSQYQIEYVCVSVAEKNDAGKKFWAKLGFSTIKTISRYDTQQIMYGNIHVYCKSA